MKSLIIVVSIVLGLCSTNVWADPSQEPVAYWSFDDPIDPGHDGSGNGHNGTVYGATSVEGICGNALSFDGVDDYVSLPASAFDSLYFGGEISIVAWMKTTASGDRTAVMFEGNWLLYFDGAQHGVITAVWDGSWQNRLSSSINIADNQFHHVVSTYSAGTARIYVDGVLRASEPRTLGNGATNRFSGGYFNYYPGLLDEVSIYDRALSEGEISDLANECAPPESPCGFSDDFEDSVIDTSLWIIGGRKTSWSVSYPGSWTWSHDEITDPVDGYLRSRVQGLGSGNSYGAVSWVHTVYNFNDGNEYTLNFTWKADVSDDWVNTYYIQVTDGYVYSFDENPGGWFRTEGTADLLKGPDAPEGREYHTDSEKLTWSIGISASEAKARLYDGPDATGSLLHEGTLDPAKPWYVRFALWDATSSGFPAGDSRLNLYDFSAVCEPPEPNIAVSPLSHDFGDVELGTSSTVVVTISNVGNGELTVSGIGLQTDFAITSVPPASIVIGPSETVDVEITYTPTVLGRNSAVLKITSDDPDEPVVEVQLSAVGVEIPPPPSEQIANILAFFDTSVDDGTLAGDGPVNSAEKRLNALRNMLEAAGDLIENDLFEVACQQLIDIYKKTDGQPKPPDFVKGDAAPELASMIVELRGSLGCE